MTVNGKLSDGYGVLRTCWRVVCKCHMEFVSYRLSRHTVTDEMKAEGWVKTTESGWICPLCVLERKMREERDHFTPG